MARPKVVKNIAFPPELWDRAQECMARTKIFNASEFVRLALESALERVEKRFSIVPPVVPPSKAGSDELE